MTWAAPLWLLGLVPWTALAVYLLWGRRRRTDVPFLELWQVPAEGVRVRRRASPPPLALALAILAMLLAVFAAARPAVPWFRGGPTISVVIDRGYTMSARGAVDGATRTAEAVDLVESPLGAAAGLDRMERWIVPGPGPQTTDFSDLGYSPALTPTAVDTRDALRVATRAALRRNNGPVIVLSDQPPGTDDERLIRVGPSGRVRNARVVLLAAREGRAAQVMVRVRGATESDRATVRVTSGGASAEKEVELSVDRETDTFIDLPRLADSVKAELLMNDEQPADDTAWLVREASWPRLEARAPLPAHVQRMVEVYARQRPPGDESRRVVIVRDAGDLTSGEPGVVLPPVAGEEPVADARGAQLEVADHAVTRGVSWADVGSPAVAVGGPPAGWTPVVSAGGKVWVAVREQPIRAVWVGFDSAAWARSAEFVVFWANVFNWAGAGGERFASYPVGSLEGDWQSVELAASVVPPEAGLWPGLYRRADGTLRAPHAQDVPFPAVSEEADWRPRLERLLREGRRQLPLAPVILLAALGCLLAAALAWKPRHRRGPTGPSPSAT